MIQFPDIDPVIISLGLLSVSWYSLSYVVGILVGWWYIVVLIKRYAPSGISTKNIDDLISWVIIGVIVGGRMGYVLFYDPIRYLSEPLDILKTYNGGMSFHGGIIGVIVTIYLFAKRNKLSFWVMSDLCSAATPIGLFLGRVANFINAELYGRVTDMPWGVMFPYTDSPRHPSQLYEAFFEGVILFFILLYFIKKKKALTRKKMLSGLFLLLYGIFRFFIEYFREADSHIGYFLGYITLGQILCLPMILIGSLIIYYSSSAKKSNKLVKS